MTRNKDVQMIGRKQRNKKRLFGILIVAILFLTISMNHCIANPEYLEDSSLCYGFIVPLVKCENVSIENKINCKIKHLVNDLLREEIPVFWTTTNITSLIKEIDENEKEMFFEKGTFIIPFTGNNTQDKKISAMIYDYNQSSEIESNNAIAIPVYLLLELLNVQVYPLSEVKIVQYKDLIHNCEIYYIEIAKKCGFLTFEFLDYKDVKYNLSLTNFNVFIGPGGGTYASFFNEKTFPFYMIHIDVKYKVANTIRDFVANGGGYIGSCGGAVRASSGTKSGPLLIYFPRRAYNTKLGSIGLIAISDVIYSYPYNILGDVQAKIVNDSHPVTYGLDQIVPDFQWGGPQFTYVGKNSQVVARYHNTSRNDWNGTPSWVSSKFGDGRVVIFSTHPEILGFRGGEYLDNAGNTIISNALYYTTSDKKIEIPILYSKNFSFIENTWQKTADLTSNINQTDNIFYEIKIEINKTISNFLSLSNDIQCSRDLIRAIADEKHIDFEEMRATNFLGFIGMKDSQSHLNLFMRYFENTSKILDIIIQIYPLLKNNTNFINQIEALKEDLYLRIIEAQIIYEESYKLWKNYKDSLNKYANQKGRILQKLQEINVNNNGHKLYRQIRTGFHYIPQTYFSSLKLLRGSWYNYEAERGK